MLQEAEASADALKLLHSILDLHKFDVLQPYLESMTKVLCDTVSGGIEQLKAEALSVIAAVSKLTAGKGQKVRVQPSGAFACAVLPRNPHLCFCVAFLLFFSSPSRSLCTRLCSASSFRRTFRLTSSSLRL